MKQDNWLRNMQNDYEDLVGKTVRIFTYAFGSDANTLLPQIIACENQGIFRQVDDGSDLGQVMYIFSLAIIALSIEFRFCVIS